MKYKTAELEGAELDYWVAKACDDGNGNSRENFMDVHRLGFLHYSSEWSLGGPIIERNFIQIYRNSVRDASGHFHGWVADCPRFVELKPRPKATPGCSGSAIDPLTAAMRAFVAAKLGEEVDLP